MDTPNLPIKKITLSNKSIQADFKALFAALSKGAIMYQFGKLDNAVKEVVDIIKAFTFKKDPSSLAYQLVRNALINASHNIIEENKGKLKGAFQEAEKLYDHKGYVKFLNDISKQLKEKEYFLRLNDIKQPRNIALLEDYKSFFSKWLSFFGFSALQINNIVNRFPSYFVLEMHNEWRSDPNKYQLILDKLDSPMSDALKMELEWDNYFAFLEKQVDEPVFDEAFSLAQIYVPLEAYFEKKVKDEEEIVKTKKQAVHLEQALNKWLSANNTDAGIKVISGGPGSGKSTSVKMWSSKIAKEQYIKTLFIPLHLLNLERTLEDSIKEYFEKLDFFSSNPLEVLKLEKLLIIFDGLDELSQQGKVGETVAKDFVREIERNCMLYNNRQLRLFVLLSGRELVIQSISNDFKKEEQILYLLPYNLSKNYIEINELLNLEKDDKRNQWWVNYGNLIGNSYAGIPEYLTSNKLSEITSQPLLNYLVALSVKRGKLKFTDETNLNEIYLDLIEGVHERAYENREYEMIRGLDFDKFIRILEEIAVSAWHGGDVRTTTVNKIEQHIENSGLNKHFEIFQEGAQSGITRLLTAFYFRQTGIDRVGDKTFEFTHKSFGEYLTARRLVNLASKLVSNLKLKQEDMDSGWDEKTASYKWLQTTGATTIDEYLFDFIQDELKISPLDKVKEMQINLCQLFNYTLKKGFDFGGERKNHLVEVEKSKNAEEALFVLINACARITKEISNIHWGNPGSGAFSAFLSRMQPFRVGDLNTVSWYSCSYLKLPPSLLFMKDLQSINLEESILTSSLFVEAILRKAILIRTDLQYANLQGANLHEADLRNSNLSEANLQETILWKAKIHHANLRKVKLQDANLEQAELINVDLQEADLQYVILQGATLRYSNLKKVNLQDADLQYADLYEVCLQNSDLRGANLADTNLQNANLQKAKLQETNLQRANLQNANLQRANLRKANLQGANLQGANLQGANLQGANLKNVRLTKDDLQKLEGVKGEYII